MKKLRKRARRARRAAAGLALLFPAAWAAAKGGAGAGWSAGEAGTLRGGAQTALNLSCYFAETPVACRAASEGPPDWLSAGLASMRDCLVPGEIAETGLWAYAFRDAEIFLKAAQATASRAQKGEGLSPARVAGELAKPREDLASRLAVLDGGGFGGSLGGRGSALIGQLRVVVDRMGAAIAAARAGRDDDFRADVLGVAWQLNDAHAAFAGPPPAGAQAQEPACTRLSDLDANAPARDEDSLRRLIRIARLYQGRGDFALASKAYGFALSVAQALGEPGPVETLDADLAQEALELGDNDGMRAHMAAALDLARRRNDVYAERALLEGFLSRLKTSGLAGDLQAQYARRLSDIADQLAGAHDQLERAQGQFARSQYAQAKQAFQESADLGSALSALRIAQCDEKLGHLDSAAGEGRRAVELARAQGQNAVEAEGYLALARLGRARADTAGALDALEALLRLSFSPRTVESLPAELRRALQEARPQLLSSLEDLYNVADQWERARSLFTDLREQARDDGESSFLARVYLGRAETAGALPDKAVETFEEALGLLDRGDAVSQQAAALCYRSLYVLQPYWTPALRDAVLDQGQRYQDYEARRLKALGAAVEAAKAQRDPEREASARLDLAAAEEREASISAGGSLAEGTDGARSAGLALEAYRRALAAAKDARRSDLRIAAWRGIGRVLAAQQDYDGAVAAFGRALTTALWDDGRTLVDADPSGQALASAVALRLGDAGQVAALLRGLAYAQAGRGAPLTAIAYMKDSLDLQPDDPARFRTVSEFARRLDTARDGDQAVEFLRGLLAEPRVQGDVRLQAAALTALAGVQSKTGGLGQDEALQWLEQAYALLKPGGFEPGDIPLLLGLGRGRLAAGRAPEAARAFEDALEVADADRAGLECEKARLAFTDGDPARFEDYRAALSGLLSAAMRDPAYAAEGFVAADRLRGRVLLEALAGADLESQSPLRRDETSVSQRLILLLERRAGAGWSVADAFAFHGLQDRLARLAEQIRGEDPHYASLRYPPAASAAQTQKLLRPREVLVAYMAAADATWAFVLHPDGPLRLYDLKVPAPGPWRPPPPGAGADGAAWREASRGLASVLWDPLADELKGAKKVLIVPDGDLWEVPFAALDSSAGVVGAQGYAIEVLPSAALLAESRTEPPRKPAAGRVAAFAPIAGGGAGARALQGLFPDSEVLFPPQATRDRAVQDSGGYERVLFDAPCRADETRPWLSSVDFIGAGGGPEPLTAADAMRLMALDRTRLVALDDCGVARFGLARGSGLMGWARGLIFAGAGGSAASLWPVPQAAAADLMGQFFAGMAAGTGPADALMAAQARSAAHQYGGEPGSDPYFWAGFEIYGDPQ